MKKALQIFIILYFSFLATTSFAQKYSKYPNILEPPTDLPIIDGVVTYQGVIEVKGASMQELYGLAKKFIAEKYRSTDAAIDMDDTLNGVIVVKGRADVPIIWFENIRKELKTIRDNASVKHLLIFEMKEGRLRYTIKDLSAEKTSTYYSIFGSYTTDSNFNIETHLTIRKNFDAIEDPDKNVQAIANYSGAFLVGVHQYFTAFANEIEPYLKSQKADDW